jgi:hypothetical protein
MNARPRSDIERHLVADRTTVGARLGTRIPAVALDERLAGACRLVFEKASQHTPTRIADGFCQFVVLHHSLHIQGFDAYHLVFVNNAAADFVKMVASGARDMLMRSRHQSPCLIPAVRSFLLARQFALFPFQVLLRLAQMAGVLKLRSVAGDGEMGQPNVDADRLALGGHRRQHLAVVGQNGRMKLAAGVAADRDSLERADDLAVNDALNPSYFRQIDAVVLDLDALRILDRLATVLGLEARVFATLLKEVLERTRQVLQGRLQRLAVRITEPFKLLLQLWKPDRHRMIVQAFARGAIEIARQSECVVPRPPRTTELNGQRMGLFIGRIEANAGCSEHPLGMRDRCLKGKWPYIHALNGGVLRPKMINPLGDLDHFPRIHLSRSLTASAQASPLSLSRSRANSTLISSADNCRGVGLRGDGAGIGGGGGHAGNVGATGAVAHPASNTMANTILTGVPADARAAAGRGGFPLHVAVLRFQPEES